MRIAINAWRDVDHPLAGGSEEYVDRIASGLAERGHEVTLVAGRPVSTHPYRTIENGGRYSQYLRAPFTHQRHCRGADVVVDVANGMTYFAPLWRRGPTVVLVHHVHDLQWRQWFSPPVAATGRFLERRVVPLVYGRHLFVTVSPSTAAALEQLGLDLDQIRIVPNGIDLVDGPSPESEEPVFLVLARLVPHKRVHLAVEAWREVQKFTGGRLVVAGYGPEAARIEEMGVDRVELLGKVTEEEKHRWLSQAWLLVHPSMLEGWGLVVMEAAAHGKPTLGFVAPGVRDSVVDGVTGMLATSFEEFVRRWIELAADHELRHHLGDAARDRAASFPWDLSAKGFEDVILEAMTFGRRNRGKLAVPRALTESRPTAPAVGRIADPAPSEHPIGPDEPESVATRWELFRLFLREKHDPTPFYEQLARCSAAHFPLPVDGIRLLDLGCGHGEDSREFLRKGARVTSLDFDFGDWLIAAARPGALQGDATALPFPDGTFDLVYSSNLLEHTPDPSLVFDEIARVLTPGGRAWVSWTNWYSPWGGHEIVPLHYLGPKRGLRVWRRLFGEPRKNVPFDALWPTYVGRTLRHVRNRTDLRLLDAMPRYYPSQRWILRVPGLREVVTWNCVMVLERPRIGAAG